MIAPNRNLLLSSALVALSFSTLANATEKPESQGSYGFRALNGIVGFPYQFTKTLFEPFIEDAPYVWEAAKREGQTLAKGGVIKYAYSVGRDLGATLKANPIDSISVMGATALGWTDVAEYTSVVPWTVGFASSVKNSQALWSLASSIKPETLLNKSLRLALYGGAVYMAASVPMAAAVTLGTQFQVSKSPLSGQFTSTAALANGGGVVVWSDQSYNIIGSLISPNGTVTNQEFPISLSATGNSAYPCVASLKGGNFFVSWPASTPDILIRFFSSDASPIGNPTTVNTVTPTNIGGVSCASFSDGTGGVAYEANSATYDRIFVRSYSSSGVPLGNPFQINQDSVTVQGVPSISGFPGLPGTAPYAHVAWPRVSSGNWRIVDRIIMPGNGTFINNEQIINQDTTISQGGPSAAAFTNGNGVVVWEKGTDNIIGRIISPTGIPQGNEFQVPTNTTVQQSAASITGLIDDTALVVFVSGLVGNDYGRSFSSNGTALNSEFPIPNNPSNIYQGPASIAGVFNGNTTDAKALVAWYGTTNGAVYNIYGRYVSSLIPVSPTPTPTPTPTGSFTPSPTPKSSPTSTPTPTPTSAGSPTPSPTPTSSPTPIPTLTPTPTSVPMPTGTPAPTTSPTPSSAPAISPAPAPVPSGASSLTPIWLSFPRDVVSYLYGLYRGA